MPGESALRFQHVKRGWTSERVLRAIGAPLNTTTEANGYMTWYYADGRAVTLDPRGRVVVEHRLLSPRARRRRRCPVEACRCQPAGFSGGSSSSSSSRWSSESRNARSDLPRKLPTSGRRLGPNTSSAITRMTSNSGKPSPHIVWR